MNSIPFGIAYPCDRASRRGSGGQLSHDALGGARVGHSLAASGERGDVLLHVSNLAAPRHLASRAAHRGRAVQRTMGEQGRRPR